MSVHLLSVRLFATSFPVVSTSIEMLFMVRCVFLPRTQLKYLAPNAKIRTFDGYAGWCIYFATKNRPRILDSCP